MANQKAVRYFLVAGVIVVWGLIIYRVVEGLSGDDELPPVPMAATKAPVLAETPVSYTLIADYPDPFIPGSDSTKLPITTPTLTGQTAAAPPLVHNAPPPDPDAYKEGMIQYLGMIANPARKLKIASVKIKGTEYLLREGDQAGGCKMKKIAAERIALVYKGKHITINKNSN